MQSAGGRVLVRASVTTILEKGGKVCGVRVAKVRTLSYLRTSTK